MEEGESCSDLRCFMEIPQVHAAKEVPTTVKKDLGVLGDNKLTMSQQMQNHRISKVGKDLQDCLVQP